MELSPLLPAITPASEEVTRWILEAKSALQDFEAWSKDYADCAHTEAGLEAERHVLLDAIRKQLMLNEPSLSATRAGERAHIHVEYLSHLELKRDTVRRKDDAYAGLESARMRAYLAIAVINSLRGGVAQ